ncbi:MAG: hypothetical protein NTW29_08565 [Bacteroidetes bacterium]|nr:hypothetical protein [Bacteroidota bacterium]
MRKSIALTCLLFPLLLSAQKNKFSLYLMTTPELTFHKSDYTENRLRTSRKTATFNGSIEAGVAVDASKRVFLQVGLGYIPRKLNAVAYLDQQKLPPPQQSASAELVATAAVIQRTVLIPLAIGYRFLQKEKLALSVHAGLTGNYLLNTYYKLNAFQRYQGAYKKGYWQGLSCTVGLETEQRISAKLTVTGKMAYAIVNTVQKDEYLFSQTEDAIELPHRFLQLGAGVKFRL